MPAREETDTPAQTIGSRSRPTASSSSTLSFMKVLCRIAHFAPDKERNSANTCVKKLTAVYEEALELINKKRAFDPLGIRQEVGPLEVMLNLRTTAAVTNTMNIACQSVGVPYYDEEWVETYWIPMSRLIKSIQSSSMADDAMEAAMNMFLKVDMPQLSSHCKAELLRVLGELLDMPFLTAQRANEVVNLVIKVLFDDRAEMAESRATRRATAKVIMKSNITGPFLKFLLSKPLENERGNEDIVRARKDVQYDICYLLSLVLTTILGEMDSSVAQNHASSIKAAIDSVSPHLWDVLDQFGDERIRIMDMSCPEYGSKGFMDNIIRFKAITTAFQCLAVFSNGSGGRQHDSRMLEFMAYKISRFHLPHLDPNAQEHKRAVALVKSIFKQKVPLNEDGREYFALSAELSGLALTSISEESTNRVIILGGDNCDYPIDFSSAFNESLPREEVVKLMQKVYNDQKSRGLLNDEHKSAVKEPVNGTGEAGSITKCAMCGEEGVSGSNLKLMRCGGCQRVWYCTAGCQKAHWTKHKAFCKRKQAENKK